MSCLRLSMIAIALLVVGCSSSVDPGVAQGADPLESFRALATDIAAAGAEAGRQPTHPDPNGEYEYALTGGFEIDVTETDSLVSPYAGYLILEMLSYRNGELLGDHAFTLEGFYSFKDDAWVMDEATSCSNFRREGTWRCEEHPPYVAFWTSELAALP